jgi:hypothetical protein
MKPRIFIILSLVLFALSCKKTEVIPNQTVIINLPSGNWLPLNGGKSYTTAIDLPELDDYTHERAGVLVYISFGDKTYEQIPQVYNGDAYSFVTRPGQVVLEVQRYDGVGVVNKPSNTTIKIVLVKSEI